METMFLLGVTIVLALEALARLAPSFLSLVASLATTR